MTQHNLGLLLVGHGTRDPGGLAETEELANRVAQAAAVVPVELGYIELAEPRIDLAFERLVQRGVKRVCVVPLLLFPAAHAKSDIPRAIDQLATRHVHLEIEVAAPIGQNPRILALLRRRYTEAQADRQGMPSDEIYWLLVGRGSSDSEATDAMAQLANAQSQALGLIHFGWCFVAAARPSLAEGLAAAVERAASGVKRIVVQPHLLFRGAVLDEVQTAVEFQRAKHSDIEWVTAAHLGSEQEVVQAVLDRITGD